MIDYRALWADALTFDAFLAVVGEEHRELWEGIFRLTKRPSWVGELVPATAGLKLLVLVEDWCGDASNTVPVLARMASETPGVELRVLLRDQHPEVMDRYLTNGSRSIPIVIVLDREFGAAGQWGPRPAELQAWVTANRATLPKVELYSTVRKWYARDCGETTLREVLAVAGLRAKRVA